MRPIKSSLLAFAFAFPALAQQPLSAIDWLNEPFAVPVASPRVIPGEVPVTVGITVPDIAVMPLEGTRRDAVGLLPSSVTGLPAGLWLASSENQLLNLWRQVSPEPLPAIQALYYTLLLAEAEPPAGDDGRFLKARVNVLTRYGAVEPAQALLERSGTDSPVLFPTWFDITLLTGNEGTSCASLRQNPNLMDDYAARVFCHARDGDWTTAALLFDTARALDVIDPLEQYLLDQYLSPELIDDAVPLAPPSEPSPLVFHLYEAAGAPLPTRNLPLAFATADLRNTSGWKAEIEAAERLVRTGAISENRLLGLYTDREPAASGGVWSRVRAVQNFDTALTSGDVGNIATTLPPAWDVFRQQRLEIAFARLFSGRLSKIRLPPDGQALAFRIALLDQDYETPARAGGPDAQTRFLASIALGQPDAALANTALEKRIASSFDTLPKPAPAHADLLKDGKLGEAILSAANLLDQAGLGNLDGMAEGLATLRAVGLEDTARRAALQLLILERRK